jgi:hypothetical protein
MRRCVIAVSVLFLISSWGQERAAFHIFGQSGGAKPAGRQLLAVRGEIVSLKPERSGLISMTVRPAREFSEATVLMRENDLVGTAVRRGSEVDLLGLLSGDGSDDEPIRGDIVSVIYDPQSQNRVLEVYRRP